MHSCSILLSKISLAKDYEQSEQVFYTRNVYLVYFLQMEENAVFRKFIQNKRDLFSFACKINVTISQGLLLTKQPFDVALEKRLFSCWIMSTFHDIFLFLKNNSKTVIFCQWSIFTFKKQVIAPSHFGMFYEN